jgi:hypothetical protein
MKVVPLVLVPDTVPNETVACLRTLLRHAAAGEIVGVGFVALLKPDRSKALLRPYIANTAGAAHEDPTLTRGMLLGLDDKLSHRIHGGDP